MRSSWPNFCGTRYSARKTITFAVLGIFLIVLSASAIPDHAETTEFAQLCGSVIDTATRLPLPNVSVALWDGRKIVATETDASGFYTMNIAGKKSYQIYAYRNFLSVPSYDYVPAYKEIYLEGGAHNLSFMLSPGACISMRGELRFFKTLQPPRAINFSIIYKSGLRTNATSYNEDSILVHLLNLRGRLMFVPCDVPIKVEARIQYTGGTEYHILFDDNGDFLTLSRGKLLTIDLEQRVLLEEINSCNNYLVSTYALVEEAEGIGFYVFYEKDELLRSKYLLDVALSGLGRESYEEAYADLREAYLTVRRIEEGLPALRLNASASTLFITPFFCLTSLAIAALVSEKNPHRLAISLLLYSFLFLLVYLLYPGYVLVGTPRALTLAFTSFLLVYCLVNGLPHIFREKTSEERISLVSAITMAFSISVKNLRRRKLRTFLTISLLFTSVFAFIALTSFSIEYGFAVRYAGNRPVVDASDGFVVQKPPQNDKFPFDPIQLEAYRWLLERPEIELAAPKIENMPQESHLGLLIAPSSKSILQVLGIIGVAPSLECKVTGIDRVVLQGRFLEDEDLRGILVSKEAAMYLGVKINDALQLFDQNLTLIGVFDSSKFDRLKDFNGASFAPYLYLDFEESELGPCPGSQTVIVHQKTAQGFPDMALSRIVVQTGDQSEIMRLARQTVLKWPGVEVSAFLGRESFRLFIGSYYLANGFVPAIVPLALASLNIGVLIRNVVDERKRELMVMSSLGLNPSHITALFLAEALTIAITAGSLGYLLGITSYRFMAFLPFHPLVKHKVEAVWGILALLSSIMASALGSALPALKSSVIVTPSMVRRWRFEKKAKDYYEPWVLSMPIRLSGESLADFYTFMRKHLVGHRLGLTEAVYDMSFDPKSWKLSFNVIGESGVSTANTLASTESLIPNWYVLKLTSIAKRGAMPQREADVRVTASLVRRLILLYASKLKP